MKLAMSNIAWDPSLDREVALILRDHGFTGIELAPTKKWQDISHVGPAEALEYREYWRSLGLEPIAMQSLLFGKPDLLLFGSAAQRKDLYEELKKLFVLARNLGTTMLIFGSPRNRRRNLVPFDAAFYIAEKFFKEAAASAAEHGVSLLIEPNATFYACDFINTSDEAARLVDAVASPGFGLHLDTGNMLLQGEDLLKQVEKHWQKAKHFHLSCPQLGQLNEGMLAPLQGLFERWIHEGPAYCSVEMLTSSDISKQLDAIRRAAKVCCSIMRGKGES